MTRLVRSLGAAIVALACGAAPARAPAAEAALPLPYLSPLAGFDRVLPETNIILRPGGAVDPALIIGNDLLDVSGSASGPHGGRLRLTDDGETVTFRRRPGRSSPARS